MTLLSVGGIFLVDRAGDDERNIRRCGSATQGENSMVHSNLEHPAPADWASIRFTVSE